MALSAVCRDSFTHSSIHPSLHSIEQLLTRYLKVSFVVKRHHVHTSYKGKHSIEWLTVQRFNPFSAWWEMWRHAGSHGAGDEAMISRS